VAAFSIDRTETTNAQFRLFEEGVMPLSGLERVAPPTSSLYAGADAPDRPASSFDAFTAEAFCQFMGKALPGSDEWKKAARGGEFLDAASTRPNPRPRRPTVWGADRSLPPANVDDGDPFPCLAPVGAFPEDRSPYGVLDMAGNVAEWTATQAAEGRFRGLRMAEGGRWDVPASAGHHRLEWVNHLPPRRFDFSVGVRCVERSTP
jgi:formylglycine-generating enzyme required for sulfatase activity